MYQLTKTVSAVEVIWTACCLVGLYFAWKLLARAGGDLVMLRRRKINSTREFAALTTLFLFACIMIVQFLFVMVGVISMMLTNHPGTTAGQTMIATSFLLVSAMMDVMLFITEKRREELLRKLKEQEEKDANDASGKT